MSSRHARADWVRLGLAVKDARITEGFTSTQQWCEIVGRSDRMLLGLERGEPVGSGTLRNIEDALDWERGQAERILSGDVAPAGPRRPVGVEDLSDEQLLDELRRRLAGTTESEATTSGPPMTAAPHVETLVDAPDRKRVRATPARKQARTNGGHSDGA